MKWHVALAVTIVLCIGLFCSNPAFDKQGQAQEKRVPREKITVLTPLGTPPPIKLRPMPQRLDTLDGKTIYLVDQGYLGSDNLLKEMVVWFERNRPKTKVVFKRLGFGAQGSQSEVFAEIKEKADAVIMGTGH